MSTKKLQIIGNFLEVDSTLTQTGKAADAKATGDVINQMQTRIDEVAGLVGGSDDKYYTETEIDGIIADLNASIDSKVDAVEGKGLSTNDYTTSEKDKLATVEANANFYEHPTHTSYDLGLYKVTVDGSGHVSGATLASKEDIVALGIPAEDTKYDTEISDLSDRIDDIENSINTTNQTLSGVSQELESYKTTNNKAVATNASGIEANKTAIEAIQGDYLTSTDKTQLQDDISKVSEKATANASAIEVLNGEGDGSVRQSIDNALNAISDQFTEVDTTINNHVTNTNNPHGVTKEQLGLDKVENTSDAEKPISDAAQVALDGKADLKHDHEIGEINNLQNLLDELQVNIDTNTTAIDEKADVEHNHDDLYYDKDEILGLITVEEIDDICGSNLSTGESIDVVSMASKNWVEQFYQPKGSYLTETDINNHNASTVAHNDIRVRIEKIAEDFYTFADCDDKTLNQLQEVVNYIKNNTSLIEGITTNKVNISDIIDNLTTNVSDKPLSAAQGVVLNNLISALKTLVGETSVSAQISEALDNVSNVVKYDVAQNLTDVQKAQARANIGVDDIDLEVDEISVQLGANGTVGGYKTGDVIEAGTDIQTILNKLFQKAVPATYTSPKVTLTAQSTAAGSYEYGTNIIAKVKAIFTKNDAGAIESISILKDGVEILTGTSNTLTTDAEELQLTSTVSYTASATYAEGTIKNDNLGEPSPSGHIEAGTVTSSTVIFTPYRQGYFYGVLATDKNVPLTSDIIRGGIAKNGAYAAGNLPLISASSVANRKRIFVACPATNKGITKVIMPSAMNANCTADFVKQISAVIVEGANGSTGIAYNVWVYEPASISDDQTFTVTLG